MSDLSPSPLLTIDAKVPLPRAFMLALQHVLSMDLYVAPLILGAAIGLRPDDLAVFLQMSFFACGIATILQAAVFMKFPIVQGPSYVPLGALIAIGTTYGLPTMIGSLIPGALLIVLLGYTKLFSKFVRRAIPPFIGGIIILIVGLTLMPTAISGVLSDDGDLGANTAAGIATFVVLIGCMVLQYHYKKGRFLRLWAVIIAIVSGICVALAFGRVDFSSVTTASWLSYPQPFQFGVPAFDLGACLLMACLYLFILLDTTGTWFTIEAITGAKLTSERIDRATIGEGIGCLIGSIFGGTPMTGYSSNAGMISITGVASRRVMQAAGVLLALLGFCPKLMAVITSIPSPVINGIFGVVCVTLVTNGLRIITNEDSDERSAIIVGVSLLCAIATIVMPTAVSDVVPDFVGYFLSSGIAVGGTAAIVLNFCLPCAPRHASSVQAERNGNGSEA